MVLVLGSCFGLRARTVIYIGLTWEILLYLHFLYRNLESVKFAFFAFCILYLFTFFVGDIRVQSWLLHIMCPYK